MFSISDNSPNAKRIGSLVLLCVCILVSFWIRVLGVPELPDGQFTETDAYLYTWQAHLITEHGLLPERDMHRWLPLGRASADTLNLYPYAVAYTYKVLHWVFPQITGYYVLLYAPAFCFCIGLAALCCLLYRTYGLLFTGIVGVLLATLPGTIERSAAGFSDRDAWCLMLGIATTITYLIALQETQHPRKQLLWTLASGVLMFLGGMSWEGFGTFLSIILLVELWRFLSSETEEGLGYYLLWVCCFVPPLYLAAPVYRGGQFLTTHLAASMLIPPLGILGIRSVRYLLLKKTAGKFDAHARILALALTIISIASAIGYVLMQRHTFADTTVPFSQNQLMQTVGELNAPHFGYWTFRYGSVFIVGSLGLIVATLHTWGQRARQFALSLFFFTLTTFFRQPLDTVYGQAIGNALFLIALVNCGIRYLWLAHQQNGDMKKNPSMDKELVYLAMLGWFLLWVALARDAKRFDFFIGVPLAFFTADLIQFVTTWTFSKLNDSDYTTDAFREKIAQLPLLSGLSLILLGCVLLFGHNGGHLMRTYHAATHLRHASPGNDEVAQAFSWMKATLSDNAVVAAEWSFGSQLNVLAGVKTITDQDHYIQHWIHLYNQHVRFTLTEEEALTFLKTHGATHIMVTGKQPEDTLLRGPLSDAFVPVYPTENFEEAVVKVWALHYSPEIQPDPKYLATTPGD